MTVKKKITLIFGTRPEGIKLAPLALYLRQFDCWNVEVCLTGQHREMLDQVMKTFGLTGDVDFNLMSPNQTLASLTGKVIQSVDEHLKISKPDIVLVQGDTTTVMAAALAAFYNHIPIGHVEAGLRTGNLYSPWPEEANRVIAGHLADLHFCPTETSRKNLLREGIPEDKIFVTGNTVIDALRTIEKRVLATKPTIPNIPDILQFDGDLSKKVVLITGHRRENFGDGFVHICQAINELADAFPDVNFVYPVHMNPAVRKPVNDIIGVRANQNVHLIAPLEYEDFIAMMMRATVILTDSGGVQEEAPSLGKPVLVMRDTTERPEALAAGTVKLVGTCQQMIVDEVSRLLTDVNYYRKMSEAVNPYGDGKACERIHFALKEYFDKQFVDLEKKSVKLINDFCGRS